MTNKLFFSTNLYLSDWVNFSNKIYGAVKTRHLKYKFTESFAGMIADCHVLRLSFSILKIIPGVTSFEVKCVPLQSWEKNVCE